jgi:prepilin-type N-terminal cleavage/methylation domain-containing protein
MTPKKIRGFSLLEMMIVVAIGLLLATVSFITLMPALKKNHVDQAYDTTLSTLRTYRNLAIAQGNRYIILPTAPRTITVQLWGYVPPPGISPAPQTVATVTLPTDIQFAVQAGFPNPGPDGFGTGASAIYTQNALTGQTLNCNVVAGGQPCLIFNPDGSAQDDSGVPGNFMSGVIYITLPGQLYSSRAIDVWGTTGRTRGWRLYSVGGTNTWVQQ